MRLTTDLKESMGLRSLSTIRRTTWWVVTWIKIETSYEDEEAALTFVLTHNAKLTVVKWQTTKQSPWCAPVCLQFYSFYLHSSICQMRCYSKEEKRKISVPCPKIVSEYNNHMGGVGLAEMMIVLYHTPTKPIYGTWPHFGRWLTLPSLMASLLSWCSPTRSETSVSEGL